jgi:hypothetical protein
MNSDPSINAVPGDRPPHCPACGSPYPAGDDGLGCPVCLFQAALELGSPGEGGSAGNGPLRSDGGRFDHYELARSPEGAFAELGRGAMGITYKALDTVLGRAVALKVIEARVAARPEARQRFLREARAAARLHHPNVASVFYYGVRPGDDRCFYAMELVEGETVEARVRSAGPLPGSVALEVVAQVARALGAAEAQGLVHRDLKPSNLMLARGPELTVKVIDFGLAKAAVAGPDESTLTHGDFVGTPAFASPEQCAGRGVDVRSDLYSLGITLWHMLTGQAPFRGSRAEVMRQHLHAPLPLEQLQGVPQPLAVLLEVLLEKDPARRFQSAAQLLAATSSVAAALQAGRALRPQGLQEGPVANPSGAGSHPQAAKRKPKKVSLARLPVTGGHLFGREEDLAFLDAAWDDAQVNLVTVVAWGGVGKSTLLNHWLRRLATDHYRSAELVFGWSFYRQGTGGDAASADEFLDAALAWFGDPDPRLGSAWEKGERLAQLIARRRTLLVLDGLEPLQHPPGPQEGRLREPSLQAFVRELAAFNQGLCVITTRLAVADLADQEGTAALRLDLDHLSPEAGAQLLRALGVKGPEPELRRASQEFSGHCLALTLLGGYLTDAYQGNVHCCDEVANRLAHDVRQGAHARKVMASYQSWFGEGPELAVLCLLGLFDRPADEAALKVLLKAPAIPGLTEALTDLSPAEWRRILACLRRAKLLAEVDPHHPGQVDAHPLVREYFGEQLRSRLMGAWQEGNRRLYEHYRVLAPERPESIRAMEPLFLAVTCGCRAGLLRDALHEVYVARIQRGDACFAATVLGAGAALLSVLIHFFDHGRWGSLVDTAVEGQRLTAEDQLFVLMQAGMYLTFTQGFAAPEARLCYERAEPLCEALNRPALLYVALMGRYQYSLVTDRLTATMQIAQRIHSLAQGQNSAALMVGAHRTLATTLYYLGEFEAAGRHARCGVELWRSGGVPSPAEEVYEPVVAAAVCLCFEALCQWHLGEIASSQGTMAEAIALAKALKDTHALALALNFAAGLGYLERDPAKVERLATDLTELSARHHFTVWLAAGELWRGWARSLSGNAAEGLNGIERAIANLRAGGWMLGLPRSLAAKAEALHLADRTPEALAVIQEAEAVVERSEERSWGADLQRLRGVFLAALDADEAQIEAAFHQAISTAKQQKSISLMKRAETSRAEYRSRSGTGPARITA